MKGYLIKVTETAKETNDKRPGEVLVFYHIKGGYIRTHEELFNADGTFKSYLSDNLYVRKWIVDKEASKIKDETWWYQSAEVVEVTF